MRGPAAPTSPGPWDSHSEALLKTPALTTEAPQPTSSPNLAAWPVTWRATDPATRPATPTATATARAEGGADAAATAGRRGTADPVKALMHRHRDLCERAVDPLEIAAGLEAHGVTDRTAARFRHRDVFSLADELYARVPRGDRAPARPSGEEGPRAGWAGWTLSALAPGAVAALAVAGLALTEGPVRLAVGAAGVLGLALALAVAVRRGPLRAAGRTVPAAHVWTLWLLAYAVGGDGLLAETMTGGPDEPWDITPMPLLGLALAVAPAAWCAHLFASRARRRLAASRGLDDFAAGTRPLLLATAALHLAALAGLLSLTGFTPGALALGGLLLLARLLTVHGSPDTAAAGLAAACAAEALALAAVLAARLPGCDLLAVPVHALVDNWGTGAVPTLACGAAAVGLLAHATAALSRASAHAAP
ncbi:hypothetical protein [Streptomyces lateritius]|uniref:hypothetical protein n=1 Tax=Streptomyces lateritius TaxID=67313 RepID=UPI00198356B8|nr:hypothetical protein [Streptomyces lateritius]GGT82025.1 hypothetical protein GCM10010272_28140 [Streptomyces lateritius]